MTIAKWVPIEGRDGTQGKWHSSRLPVEGTGLTDGLFPFAEDADRHSGPRRKTEILFIQAYQPQTQVWLSCADVSAELSSKRKKERDREGEKERKIKRERGVEACRSKWSA